MSVVIVAYETDDVEAISLALDANAYGIGDAPAREVFRQATGEHIELDRAFVVAARSFLAPRVPT